MSNSKESKEMTPEEFAKLESLIAPILKNITDALVPLLTKVSTLIGTILVDGGFVDENGELTEKGKKLIAEQEANNG